MKLVKLSLSAIISVATISSVSNAKTLEDNGGGYSPLTTSSVSSAGILEDTMKNIDISGYSRYRYDSEYNDIEGYINKHRFTSDINFQSALDDNFFGVIGFRYDSGDNSGENSDAATQVGTNDTGFNYDNYGQTFNVRQFYLGYKAGNTTITAGRQVLGTFFTDDMVGTGIKVLNNDINGLTLAGMAFDNLQNDNDIRTRFYFIGKRNSPQAEFVTDRNLYSVAAIGSYDLVSFQLWYAAIDSVAQLYATDLLIGANIADIDLSLQAQYAGSSMWAENFRLGLVLPLDDAKFAAIEAGAKAFGFDANAGYVWFDTDAVSLISFEDQGSFIDAGENILEYSLISGENKYWFLKAGYTFANKVRVGADYVSGEVTRKRINSTTNEYEAVARVDYKYSKKLNFKAWYSYINRDTIIGDYKHLRFEARYNF
ncbi:major outer membrane protein [Campylobacter porcelli]|uniref:Major outer membrane protein n=1 Tax=Campylobacter porcelli TaxID=1660073 RepID=A0A1X9SYK4_9BACT|nr:major outer membrane protein [Campylobacter sp. RM6137]ARR01320.1 major outer membrane protein [Campylobacter sp. RM6137]